MENLFQELLHKIGEDPQRKGLLRTPQRAAQAFRDLTRGYSQKVEDVLGGAVFEEDYDDIIVVKDIEFYSLCEHHLLPFLGRCHVAYLPKGRIVGISKIVRLVDMFARRLQVQERMTWQIARALDEALKPRGVAVIQDAQHLCMMIRGVQKHDSRVVTSAMLGHFRENSASRAEVMSLINTRHGS
jgi:GTP cyclohydrolase I